MLKVTPIGAIDIGSNAIRLQITNIEHYDNEDVLKKVSWVRIPLRLGEDVFTAGRISDAKLAKLEDVMHSFAYMMRSFDVVRYRACATSAMREAENGAEVIERILQKTGILIEIIDGRQEADIILEGGLAAVVGGSGRNCLFVDVGGGSTELTFFAGDRSIGSRSFPLGTVRLLAHKADKDEWDRMKLWIREMMCGNAAPTMIVGSGGNINKVGRMLGKKGDVPMSYTEMQVLYDYISSFTLEERIHRLRLNVHRADVIVPALKIFLSVMKYSKIDQVITPKVGMVEGITQVLFNETLKEKEGK